MSTVTAEYRSGYSGREAADVAQITYRQLDYWARTDLIRPSLADAKGSGSRRRYSASDIAMLCFIRQMLDSGIRLDTVRTAIETLGDDGLRDGTIVLVRGSLVFVFDPSVGVDAMVRQFRDGPCHVFPIKFPDLTRGECSNRLEHGHQWPHPKRTNCKGWEPCDG